MYKLKLNQSVTTIPTVGFNVESVTLKNVKFNVWVSRGDHRYPAGFPDLPLLFVALNRQDVGGQDKIRPLWRHYYTGTHALVFVVDSQDRDRIEEARQELHRIIGDREMREALLLVFANKQDLPGAMSPAEVTEKLGLHRMRDRSWFVHPSCATSGEVSIDSVAGRSEDPIAHPVLLFDRDCTKGSAGSVRMSRRHLEHDRGPSRMTRRRRSREGLAKIPKTILRDGGVVLAAGRGRGDQSIVAAAHHTQHPLGRTAIAVMTKLEHTSSAFYHICMF